jgi:hypothetical protein
VCNSSARERFPVYRSDKVFFIISTRGPTYITQTHSIGISQSNENGARRFRSIASVSRISAANFNQSIREYQGSHRSGVAVNPTRNFLGDNIVKGSDMKLQPHDETHPQ